MKNGNGNGNGSINGNGNSSNVLNFVEKRSESIEKKRRAFERIVFKNLLGAYSVIDDTDTIYPVELIDISHDGCLFQTSWNFKNEEKFAIDKEMTLRMYFTKTSYIPVVVYIKYGKEYVGKDRETYMRYGCRFDKNTASFSAIESFIDFLYKFAEHSTVDQGESHKVFFL